MYSKVSPMLQKSKQLQKFLQKCESIVERTTWSGKTREPEKSTRKRPDQARPETVLKPTGRPDRAWSNLNSTWCNSQDILWQTRKTKDYLVLLLLLPTGFFKQSVEASENVHFPNHVCLPAHYVLLDTNVMGVVEF